MKQRAGRAPAAKKKAPAAAKKITTEAKKPTAKVAAKKASSKQRPRSSTVERPAPGQGRKVAGSKPAADTTASAKRAIRKTKTPDPVAMTAVAVSLMTPEEGDGKALTERQRQFVAEYLIDLNATQAAIRAGYSEKTAYSIGHENLKKPEIQAAITEARAKTAVKLELTRERLLTEAMRLAFFDPRRMFHADGRPKNVTELDDDTAAAIAGIEVLEEWEGSGQDRVLIGHVKKYKVAEKKGSVEMLMRHMGLFEKDNEQKRTPLEEQAAAFFAQLHQNRKGQLRPVARQAKPDAAPIGGGLLK